MITTNVNDGFIALAARLAQRAEAIVNDRLDRRARDRSGDPQRWRRPEYLWPQFARG